MWMTKSHGSNEYESKLTICVCECFSEMHYAKSLKCSKSLFLPFPDLSNLRQQRDQKEESSRDPISWKISFLGKMCIRNQIYQCSRNFQAHIFSNSESWRWDFSRKQLCPLHLIHINFITLKCHPFLGELYYKFNWIIIKGDRKC